MKSRIWNLCNRFGRVSAVFIAIATLLMHAQSTEDTNQGSRQIEGTWATQVTVRDCQTGAALRTFPALNTFNRGETMIDTTTGAGPVQRSPGLGKWEKTGPHTYGATSLAFLFSPTGAWTGTQKLSHVIEVQGDDNAFRSTVQIFDTGGNTVSTGCATAIGRRM